MPDSLKVLQAKWKRKRCLDIRRTGNGRWYDQKVTPDVMAMVSKAIIFHLDESGAGKFSVEDLRKSDEFRDSMVQDFKKPHPKNPNAKKEYDKFLGQPLRVLESATFITKDGRQYSLDDKHRSVLCQMAESEQFAAEFLNAYIQEVMRQSGLGGAFQNFFDTQTNRSFLGLKSKYERFIIQHTGIKTKTECRRIFSKVLNIQAYFLGKKGSIQGHLSKAPITINDIRYNRINFREARTRKLKRIPRKQIASEVQTSKKGGDANRSTRRVVYDVKRYHGHRPEIQDRFSAEDSSNDGRVEGHHIFPRSAYPALARQRENIILLTSAQHQSQAHDREKLHYVKPKYQHRCLEKKLDSIMNCEHDRNCNFYSFNAFKEMLSVVKILGRDYKNLTENEVRQQLAMHYRTSN